MGIGQTGVTYLWEIKMNKTITISDTGLLNMLHNCGDPKLKWILRQSTTGRGLRLHQDKNIGKYDTPRQAIFAYFQED